MVLQRWHAYEVNGRELEPVMIKLIKIPKQDIPDIWGSIVKWIEDAVNYPDTSEDVRIKCLLGQITLWVIYNDIKPTGFLTTIINPEPCTCYAPWLGGENLDEWVIEGFDQLKEYLKTEKCLSFSWIGRAAWKRLVKVDSVQSYYLINL